MDRLTIRTDTCIEPENDIIYSNPNDLEGMYNILDLAKQAECGDGTEAGILLNISSRLAEYEDTGLSPAEVAELAQALQSEKDYVVRLEAIIEKFRERMDKINAKKRRKR